MRSIFHCLISSSFDSFRVNERRMRKFARIAVRTTSRLNPLVTGSPMIGHCFVRRNLLAVDFYSSNNESHWSWLNGLYIFWRMRIDTETILRADPILCISSTNHQYIVWLE